jgi:hypothetical protein
MGLTALIEPGVLPNISCAAKPTAPPSFRTVLVPLRTATTEGSLRTTPLSRTQTKVLHVPRSMPISVLNLLNTVSNTFNSLLECYLSGINVCPLIYSNVLFMHPTSVFLVGLIKIAGLIGGVGFIK